MPVDVDFGREPRLAVNIVQNNRNESSQASRAVQTHELESQESSPVGDSQRMGKFTLPAPWCHGANVFV